MEDSVLGVVLFVMKEARVLCVVLLDVASSVLREVCFGVGENVMCCVLFGVGKMF